MHTRTFPTSLLLLSLLAPFAASAQLAEPPPTRAVVLLSGRLVPVQEFWAAFPDTCLRIHFHAASGGAVTALDGTVIPDPNSAGCGYGTTLKIFDVFVTDLPDGDFDGLPDSTDANPSNPDGDADGTPDGNEDADGDKLTLGQEFWLTGTSDSDVDTDGDLIDDRMDHLLTTASREFVTIPLIANLYNGSAATDAHVRESIENANIVLARAGLRFELVDVREGVTEGDDGSGGGTAGDGVLTTEERDKVFANGVNEVRDLPGNKGFKVNFAKAGGLIPGSTSPGVSYHRVGAVGCSQRASTVLTGATLAHELFHVLTLKHPVAGSPEDTPGNIMTPSNGGRDDFVNSADDDKGIENVSLTPGQLTTVIDDGMGRQLGTTGTRRSPAQKKEYESALATDPVGDQGAAEAWRDLAQLQLASDEDMDTVHALLTLDAPLPVSGDYQAIYSLLFDADASSATGATVDGFTGIDAEVQLVVMHNDADGVTLVSRGYLHPGAVRQLLPYAPQVHPVLVRADDATVPDSTVADLVEVHIPKAVLALTAATVPTHVVSKQSEFAAAADTMSLDYQRLRWQADPTLAIAQEYAQGGEVVPFTLSGMGASVPFELRFDDLVVASGTLDGTGAFSGSFIVPVDAAESFHFVTARDQALHVASSGVVVQIEIFSDGFEAIP